MSNKKFEQLIEYVINDEESKARDLFHEIVVEKSREIYENIMSEEFGDPADEFIDSVSADEEGMDDEFGADEEFGDDEMGDEFGADEMGDEFGGEADSVDLEDRVVDLEDKLDELMAEFDALAGDDELGDEGGFESDDEGMDDEFATGDDEGMDDEFGADEEFGDDDDDQFGEGFNESVSLTAVPKPSNSDTADNKKSVGLQNSGKKGVGSGGNPIKTSSATENGRSAPSTKELGVNGPQAAGKGAFKSKAPAAKTGEQSGTNAKSLVRK